MTTDESPQMLVSKIESGTVIDKIPPGKSLQILRILRIDEDAPDTVAVAIKVTSQSMGRKDIIKLTNRYLNDEEYKKIWLIAPLARIVLIQHFDVSEKFNLADRELSQEFTGVLSCQNPTCATNYREPVEPKFSLMQRDPLLVRCLYCDRVMIEVNIRDQL
ncbi:MAG: aspartate carbamoyltransferase regulatory subunit [Candidatus Kariarchaeaceae archaeon]|jgi:aspartate carbamoyltransferase regulatory subunit